MANFGIVKARVSDFAGDRARQRVADIQAQQQEMQLQQQQQQMVDDQAMRSVMQRAGGDWNRAAQEAAAAGVSPEALMRVQDRAQAQEDRQRTVVERGRADKDYTRKEAADRLAVSGKLTEMLTNVTDQDSYNAYRQNAQAIAAEYNLPFNVPETYDPKYVAGKRAAAAELRRVWRTLTPTEEREMGIDESGDYSYNPTTGEVKPINKPPSQQKSVEQWNAMAPDAAEAAGFPAGSVVQRSTRGRISAAYTPAKGEGRDPAKVATANKIMAEIPGLTWEEAYDKANTASVNPVKFAAEMVKLEAGGTGMEPEKIQERMNYWVENFPGRKPTQPADGLPAAAAQQLREGHITTFGNGQQWTLQGGKQVRVK